MSRESEMRLETREPPKNLKVGKQPDGSIVYFGFAARPTDGLLGQMLVTHSAGEPGFRKMTQVWTGVVYNSSREAWREMERLNCEGGCYEHQKDMED